MHNLYEILAELDKAKIHYSLQRDRPDTIRIDITIVGKRIEIDVFDNGNVETCVFSGSESPESGIDFVRKVINENRG